MSDICKHTHTHSLFQCFLNGTFTFGHQREWKEESAVPHSGLALSLFLFKCLPAHVCCRVCQWKHWKHWKRTYIHISCRQTASANLSLFSALWINLPMVLFRLKNIKCFKPTIDKEWVSEFSLEKTGLQTRLEPASFLCFQMVRANVAAAAAAIIGWCRQRAVKSSNRYGYVFMISRTLYWKQNTCWGNVYLTVSIFFVFTFSLCV